MVLNRLLTGESSTVKQLCNIIGGGEESLPWLMENWRSLKERCGNSRADMIAAIVGSTTWAYAPQF